MEKAIKALEKAGYTINGKDKARLCPFGHDHIIIVGNYSFELGVSVAMEQKTAISMV